MTIQLKLTLCALPSSSWAEYLQKHPDLKAVLLSEDLKHVAMTNSASKIVNIIDKDMTVDIIPPKGKIAFADLKQK